MVPELEYEAGEWVVPLIQTGSWLEGSYLVSSAIINESQYDKASNLCVNQSCWYFLKYVQRRKRPKPLMLLLHNSKKHCSPKTIASKEQISPDDVKHSDIYNRYLHCSKIPYHCNVAVIGYSSLLI